MKEAELIDTNWQEAIDLLTIGQSVFLSVPEHYGGGRFMEVVRKSDTLAKAYTIVNLQYFKDSVNIDFKKVLEDFQVGEPVKILLPSNNKYNFIEALRKLVYQKPFLVLITSTYHSFNNVSILVDLFHDIIKQFPNGQRKNLTILLLDDYSMYFYENKRTYTDVSSSWHFFARFHIAPLRKSPIVDKFLLDFFHQKELVEKISNALFKISGGHQGLISDMLKYIFQQWQSINFNNVEQELELFIKNNNFIDRIGKEYLSLSPPELQAIYSFRHKKFFETNDTDLVKRFFTKGVLVNAGDLHIEIIKGAIRNSLETLYKSKTMGTQKKLVLCIHGLDGSDSTWCMFKELYNHDVELKKDYDFATYVFPTSKYWNINFFKAKVPAIQQLAKGLETEIEYKYDKYPEIVLVCHSLGGLVGRQFLLNRFLHSSNQSQGQQVPIIRRIIMYATPHNGSGIANVAKYITIRNAQVRQLAKKSDFLESLNDHWMKTGAHNHYKGWYVVGGIDEIVDKDSAGMFWGNERCKTVIFADHFSVIKPVSEKDLSYLIFRKTLLEEL
jgi:predicted alpha/beta hydrolase family esterase